MLPLKTHLTVFIANFGITFNYTFIRPKLPCMQEEDGPIKKEGEREKKKVESERERERSDGREGEREGGAMAGVGWMDVAERTTTTATPATRVIWRDSWRFFPPVRPQQDFPQLRSQLSEIRTLIKAIPAAKKRENNGSWRGRFHYRGLFQYVSIMSA